MEIDYAQVHYREETPESIRVNSVMKSVSKAVGLHSAVCGC